MNRFELFVKRFDTILVTLVIVGYLVEYLQKASDSFAKIMIFSNIIYKIC